MSVTRAGVPAAEPAADAAAVWTVLELVRWTTAYLGERDVPEPRLTAELLLAGSLGLERLDVYLQFERPLRADELARFKQRLLRRLKREPLQYIEGEAAFRELRLRVDARVLIPRPETEVLVGEVLAWARGRSGLSALDIGTGSGAIVLSLATEGEFARLVATDASAAALEVARLNHAALSTARSIEFREGDAYAPLAGERFDVIVSNPPYVALREAADLAPEVRDWEPAAALFAGETGLELIERLIAGAPDHLRPGGLFALEVGAAQAAQVAEMLRRNGAFREIRVRRDLAGRERCVLAEHARAGPGSPAAPAALAAAPPPSTPRPTSDDR